MFKGEDISVVINGHQILDGISLTVNGGEILVVIGPNGAGKSTLLKSMIGLIKTRTGSFSYLGHPLQGMPRREIAKIVAYLPQNTTPVVSSVSDATLLGRKPYLNWRPSPSDLAIVEKVLTELNLNHLKEKCVTKISGGEFQKVLIARALVQSAKVLLLDEPINHLDIKNQIETMDIVRELTFRLKLATIIVMHDLNFALRYANQILLLQKGKTAYFGTLKGLADGKLSEVYQVNLKIASVNGQQQIVF